ncbi:hypothetical protein D9M70_552360 [compost metagenome]
MFDQVSGADIAAHAVSEEDDGQARILLANVPVEGEQVADHLAPAAAAGVVAEFAVLRRAPVTALVDDIKVVAGGIQYLAQPLVAAAVLGHAMGEHHHAPGGLLRGPVAGVQRCLVTGGQPVGGVGHLRSPCAGRAKVAAF